MDFTEKTVSEENVFSGRLLKVYKDEIILPDGNKSTREYVRHNGGACVVCVVDGKMLFVKQYRYPYHEVTLEIPAGKRDGDEEPVKTAFRELEEEGGLKAKEMELLHVIYPSPGYTNEKIYVYLAKDVEKTKMHLDEDEFLNAEWISIEKVKTMLKNGDILDAKTIVGVQAYLLNQ